MLTEIYIEALLDDEAVADRIWQAWDAGEVDDASALFAWLAVAFVCVRTRPGDGR